MAQEDRKKQRAQKVQSYRKVAEKKNGSTIENKPDGTPVKRVKGYVTPEMLATIQPSTVEGATQGKFEEPYIGVYSAPSKYTQDVADLASVRRNSTGNPSMVATYDGRPTVDVGISGNIQAPKVSVRPSVVASEPSYSRSRLRYDNSGNYASGSSARLYQLANNWFQRDPNSAVGQALMRQAQEAEMAERQSAMVKLNKVGDPNGNYAKRQSAREQYLSQFGKPMTINEYLKTNESSAASHTVTDGGDRYVPPKPPPKDPPPSPNTDKTWVDDPNAFIKGMDFSTWQPFDKYTLANTDGGEKDEPEVLEQPKTYGGTKVGYAQTTDKIYNPKQSVMSQYRYLLPEDELYGFQGYSKDEAGNIVSNYGNQVDAYLAREKANKAATAQRLADAEKKLKQQEADEEAQHQQTMGSLFTFY